MPDLSKLDEGDLAMMVGLTAVAAILAAGDRANMSYPVQEPKHYTDRAAALFLAAGETLQSHPAIAALKYAGRDPRR